MGLFDDIFGTKSKTTGKTVSNQTQNESQNTNTTGTSSSTNNQSGSSSSSTTGSQSSTSQQATSGKSTVSTLAPELQTFLTGLLPQLQQNAADGGVDNAGAIREIASMLTQKATADQAALQNTIKADQDLARVEFGTGAGQEANVIAQGIGSKGNTFSQAVDMKAQSDLAAKLNAIVAQATLASQQQASADLTGAGSLLSSAAQAGAVDANTALAPLLQALEVLKGASTTSETAQSTTGSEEQTSSSATQTLEQLLSQILGTQTSTTNATGNATISATGTTEGKQSSTPGIFPSFVNLLGALK